MTLHNTQHAPLIMELIPSSSKVEVVTGTKGVFYGDIVILICIVSMIRYKTSYFLCMCHEGCFSSLLEALLGDLGEITGMQWMTCMVTQQDLR